MSTDKHEQRPFLADDSEEIRSAGYSRQPIISQRTLLLASAISNVVLLVISALLSGTVFSVLGHAQKKAQLPDPYCTFCFSFYCSLCT